MISHHLAIRYSQRADLAQIATTADASRSIRSLTFHWYFFRYSVATATTLSIPPSISHRPLSIGLKSEPRTFSIQMERHSTYFRKVRELAGNLGHNLDELSQFSCLIHGGDVPDIALHDRIEV